MNIRILSADIEISLKLSSNPYWSLHNRLGRLFVWIGRMIYSITILWKWRLISREYVRNRMIDIDNPPPDDEIFQNYKWEWMTFEEAIQEASGIYGGYPLGIKSGLGAFMEWKWVEEWCSRKMFS